MDRVSNLDDEILLSILSYVPTKTVFDAQLVSKRFNNLWRRLPSLYYDSELHKTESQFLKFTHRTMELLESPVLESLHLRVSPTEATSSGVVLRADLLAKRLVRELKLISTDPNRTLLKNAIYQLQTLVILRLESFQLEDNYGDPIPLWSLRVLELRRVKYLSDKSLSNLLQSLPCLEDLVLDQCQTIKRTTTLSITVPCLKRLTVVRCPESCRNHLMELNVNALSLEYLNVEDYWRSVSFSDEQMEELVEAKVNVTFTDANNLMRTLISVKRLSLCLITSKNLRIDGVFDQLVRLEICTCQHEWWNLLERILLSSPKLRVLKLHQKHCYGIIDPMVRWKEPSLVPLCFASNLERFEWRDYEGTQVEKELAIYILRNARRLKIATFYPVILHTDMEVMHQILKDYMQRELENIVCGSWSTCTIVFK